MKTTIQKFWGIQIETMDGEKALSYREKDGLLYFAIDNRKHRIPVPALFITKKEAEKAIKKNSFRMTKNKMKKLNKMFDEVITKVKYTYPVQLKVSLN